MVTSLNGTPVVPGIAYGPALVAVTEVSPDAVKRYGDGGHADEEAALAAYDEAAAAVADGFRAKAARAPGSPLTAGCARRSGRTSAPARTC